MPDVRYFIKVNIPSLDGITIVINIPANVLIIVQVPNFGYIPFPTITIVARIALPSPGSERGVLNTWVKNLKTKIIATNRDMKTRLRKREKAVSLYLMFIFCPYLTRIQNLEVKPKRIVRPSRGNPKRCS